MKLKFKHTIKLSLKSYKSDQKGINTGDVTVILKWNHKNTHVEHRLVCRATDVVKPTSVMKINNNSSPLRTLL